MLVLVLAGCLSAGNKWQLHGVNFSYTRSGTFERVTMFPVVWDIRSTGHVYREYLDAYSLPHGEDPVLSLLAEAQQSGFNTAIIRSELWYQEVPEPYGTGNGLFAETANAIRETGMNVIVGGFWTNFWKTEHNDAVVDYLYEYVHQTALMYDGDVIGVFGFDEPAVKYLENPDDEYRWLGMVIDYSTECRERIGLPFTSFISKHGDNYSGTWVPYSDTTSVLNRFSRFLDMVTLNMYPVKNNDRRTRTIEMNTDSILFCGATNLLPSPSPYYEVFCDQDEFYTVNSAGGRSSFCVYEFTWRNDFEYLEIELSREINLPFVPTDVASSDFRASDTGIRAGGNHNVNGAVVLWDSLSSPGGAVMAVYFDGTDLVLSPLPDFQGSETAKPLAYCIGETGYRGSGGVFDGVIGRSNTAILGVYVDDNNEIIINVFSRGGEWGKFQLDTRNPLQIPEFTPDEVVWGRFWGESEIENWLNNNDCGFVLLRENGQYITVRPSNDEESWILIPESGAYYENLFGSNYEPVSIFITREDASEPQWSSGIDFISAVFEDRFVRSRSIEGTASLDSLTDLVIQGDYTDIIAASAYHPDKRYGDVLLCITDAGILESSHSIQSSVQAELIELKEVRYASGQEIYSGARVLNTRRPIRAGILLDSSGICFIGSELYWDYYDDVRFDVFSICFETAMDNGVRSTDIDNCVFANIQSYGRHAFGLPSYCAPQDTMLYMVTLPLIKGCRGLVFYAMDLALKSGNLKSDGSLRYPNLLQNWGPSRDHGNIDLVGRIHESVAILTGNQPGGGPNYLEALINEQYVALSDEIAVNCELEAEGYVPQPQNSTLNFLVLEKSDNGRILLLASNDSHYPVSAGQAICLPGRFAEDYLIHTNGGFSPISETARRLGSVSSRTFSNNRSDIGLVLDMSGMPPVSVSLLELEPTFEGGYPGGSTFLEVQFSGGGSVNLRFKVTGTDRSMLSLYDLAGRRIETIWAGGSFPDVMEITLNPAQRPSGLYFAVLESQHHFISRKVMMFP
ncbi:MAG: hypothetical protein K8R76_01740 [Candidatus Aegiribacteria sp.]|nr:hypothetical protein [Candidatus Aegiribacteria sp.]